MCTGKAFELSPFSLTGEKFSQGTLDPDSSYFVGDPEFGSIANASRTLIPTQVLERVPGRPLRRLHGWWPYHLGPG
jgi:hypothetical protein